MIVPVYYYSESEAQITSGESPNLPRCHKVNTKPVAPPRSPGLGAGLGKRQLKSKVGR